MAKVYTAQEMRNRAYDEEHFWNDHVTAAMLRQAADALECKENRNKKYEYGYRIKVGKSVIVREFDTKAEAVQELIGNWGDGEIVRRSVGEWEDVKV